MPNKVRPPQEIHLAIVEIMKRFPAGVSLGQIRHQLRRMGIRSKGSGSLVRRVRELDQWFIIEKTTAIQDGRGNRQWVAGRENERQTLRAQVLYGAHGCCQSCGKSIAIDGINLEVELKNQSRYLCYNDRDNLWAICQSCIARNLLRSLSSASSGARPRCKGSNANQMFTKIRD